MKTITIKLYEYEELTPEAKERALKDWNEDNNDPFMQSHMINLLGEELDERGIKTESDPDVRYSLSNSQGDGFMFTGDFSYKGETVHVEHHDPHYYHSRTAEFTYDDSATEFYRNTFELIYRSICKEMEQKGYEHIEWIQSEEYFIDACESNEYTFEANGAMRNA